MELDLTREMVTSNMGPMVDLFLVFGALSRLICRMTVLIYTPTLSVKKASSLLGQIFVILNEDLLDWKVLRIYYYDLIAVLVCTFTCSCDRSEGKRRAGSHMGETGAKSRGPRE